jgi:hypothetical protein
VNAASHLESNTQDIEMIGVAALKRVTDILFPTDTDLPFWMWKILLRDVLFFQLAYPGWDITGCQYQLYVRHVATGQTREEWMKDPDSRMYDVYDLLNPHLWLIGIESLNRQYSKLFVHYPNWRCPDETDHTKWLNLSSDDYAERQIDALVSRERRSLREQQIRVQGINPCVYSVLQWWMMMDNRLSL